MPDGRCLYAVHIVICAQQGQVGLASREFRKSLFYMPLKTENISQDKDITNER